MAVKDKYVKPYSWEDVPEMDTDRKLYNKAYDEWLEILDGKHIKKKAISIINTIFQDFTNDHYLLVADLLEAIRNAEERI